MGLSWVPYRWKPVLRAGQTFRITFDVERGESLQGLEAVFQVQAGELRVPFALGDGSAQLWLTDGQVAAVVDRSPAHISIDTGAGWETLAEGFVTKVG